MTAKYVLFMYADNKGEGGTLSLMALAQSASHGVAPVFLGVGAAVFEGTRHHPGDLGSLRG